MSLEVPMLDSRDGVGQERSARRLFPLSERQRESRERPSPNRFEEHNSWKGHNNYTIASLANSNAFSVSHHHRSPSKSRSPSLFKALRAYCSTWDSSGISHLQTRQERPGGHQDTFYKLFGPFASIKQDRKRVNLQLRSVDARFSQIPAHTPTGSRGTAPCHADR